MANDKTGAPTTVTEGTDRFTIAVDGRQVGLLDFVDHDRQRIFLHTEVDDAFGGRGLASILVSEALTITRDAGLRIVAVCTMVAGYLEKHHDFDDIVDPLTTDTKRFLQTTRGG